MSADSTQPKTNPWLIAIAVILPTFIEVLDTTVVSVALPTIAGNLSATVSQATWIQTGYLISNAIVLPASAWFSSFFGRKRFFMACIAVFTMASLVCGASPTLDLLIVASIIQGAGGGALQPISQAILLETFPPAKRGLAMAAYAFGAVFAAVFGPVLGGWLTENYSWRWVFYINIPCGLVALWMVQRLVFDPDYISKAKPGRIDAVGFGFLALWLGTLQTVLNKGQDEDWFASSWIRWLAVISVISLIVFVVRELRTRNPITDLRVLADRNFTFSTILISITFFVLYGVMNLQPLLLQTLMGYTAYSSGLTQASRGLGVVIMMPLAGVLTGKVSNRLLIGVGLLLTTASSLMNGNTNLGVGMSAFFWPNVLQGMGFSLTSIPLMTVAMATIRNEQMGNATGIFALARNLAGSIGIAIVIAMVTRGAQARQATLVSHLTPYDLVCQNTMQTAQAVVAGPVGAAQAEPLALGLIYKALLLQSTMQAYVDEFRWLALAGALTIPLVFVLKRTQARGPVMVH
jgi:DHA2 family multidrug resistance protein